VPVWVIISLFRALEATAITIGILTRVNGALQGCAVVEVLVCSKKSFVARSLLALEIVISILVKAGVGVRV
jgi:hypothetical protein